MGTTMHYQKGRVRFETVLAIALFVGLMGLLIYKLLGIAEVTERLMIEGRVKQFQAALDLRFAELMMTGKQQQAIKFKDSNPVTLHQIVFPDQPIDEYMGERWDVQFNNIDAGSWIFDTKSRTLIYKINQSDLVTNTDSERLRLQWRVTPQLITENTLTGNGKRVRVESIKLELLHPFEWNY